MDQIFEAKVIDGAAFENVMASCYFRTEQGAWDWAHEVVKDNRAQRRREGEKDETFINAIRGEVTPRYFHDE